MTLLFPPRTFLKVRTEPNIIRIANEFPDRKMLEHNFVTSQSKVALHFKIRWQGFFTTMLLALARSPIGN
ncbi:MAG: hypothetical protein NZ937_00330 [Armatimonadetes bacterium]|nr:hypothetical protein [Armatimonadota bacterium]